MQVSLDQHCISGPAAAAPVRFACANNQHVVGSSAPLHGVMKQVESAAPTDCSVLIQGETGTGKELIARAIHDASLRRTAPFVVLNCAAIPSGLLESELFGHERGAFTGAFVQHMGRFQLADKGTLFLDEIGELPLELQPKLLRVLQQKEFERIGSGRTVKIDVRIVAATNQNLSQMVQDRRFRGDLYYRLNVFPINLPPLRARIDDIPELVWHFVRRFGRQMQKQIESVPHEVMDVLMAHDWPGNIRELENFIERAVILTNGPILRPPLEDLKRLPREVSPKITRTLEQAEREYILEVLRDTKWMIGGRRGAAALLGVPRTTLLYRMRRLGIPRDRVGRNPRGCISSTQKREQAESRWHEVDLSSGLAGSAVVAT